MIEREEVAKIAKDGEEGERKNISAGNDKKEERRRSTPKRQRKHGDSLG